MSMFSYVSIPVHDVACKQKSLYLVKFRMLDWARVFVGGGFPPQDSRCLARKKAKK